jgi:hypothetical protein
VYPDTVFSFKINLILRIVLTHRPEAVNRKMEFVPKITNGCANLLNPFISIKNIQIARIMIARPPVKRT